MHPYYAQALEGTLFSPSGTVDTWWMTISNKFDFNLRSFFVTDSGRLLPLATIFVGDESFPFPFPAGSFLVFTSAATGAFMGVVQIDPANPSCTLAPDMISDPNDIGPIPQPTADVLIPRDSPSVVVGFGKAANGNILLREQRWQKMPDSYSLASGQTRTVGSSITSGMSQTSSDETTVSSSISSSASAGWGPVSTSISASLSQSSTSMHSYSVSEEKTSYESSVLTREATQSALLIFRWQILDTVTVLDATSGLPVASVVSLIQPSIVQEFEMANLPPAKPILPLSEEMKTWWLKKRESRKPVAKDLAAPKRKKAAAPVKTGRRPRRS